MKQDFKMTQGERYDTLQKIVDQLEFCNYQTEDGLHMLKDNLAFIALKKLAINSEKL